MVPSLPGHGEPCTGELDGGGVVCPWGGNRVDSATGRAPLDEGPQYEIFATILAVQDEAAVWQR